MSQSNVAQGRVRDRSVLHHERRDGLLLMSSLSTGQASARQAMRRPGPRPTAEPEDSDREPGLISDDTRRESRRSTRQKDATTSANPAKRLGWARLHGRESGEGNNG